MPDPNDPRTYPAVPGASSGASGGYGRPPVDLESEQAEPGWLRRFLDDLGANIADADLSGGLAFEELFGLGPTALRSLASLTNLERGREEGVGANVAEAGQRWGDYFEDPLSNTYRDYAEDVNFPYPGAAGLAMELGEPGPSEWMRAFGMLAPAGLLRILKNYRNIDFVDPNVLARAPGNQLRRSPEEMDRFVETLRRSETGIEDPAMIYYNPSTGKYFVAEGNHRVAAAQELGLPVPTRVVRTEAGGRYGNPQYPGVGANSVLDNFADANNGYIPADLAPSELALPTVDPQDVRRAIQARVDAGEISPSQEELDEVYKLLDSWEPRRLVGTPQQQYGIEPPELTAPMREAVDEWRAMYPPPDPFAGIEDLLPPGYSPQDLPPRMVEDLQSGRFEIVDAEALTDSWGSTAGTRYTVRPRGTADWPTIDTSMTGGRPRLRQYNPEIVDPVVTRPEGGLPDIQWNFRDGWMPSLPEKGDPNLMYRGMSYEEWQAALDRGYIQSDGRMNIGEEQVGLTFFGVDPRMGESYAGGFAPPRFQPIPDRPGIVIAVPKASNPAMTVGGSEFGVADPIPLSEVVTVWEGHPYTYSVGETYDVRPGGFGRPDAVSGGPGGGGFAWREIDPPGGN